MSKLSDNKLSKLKSMSSQGGFWYITKQNLVFRDLCFMAKILEKWGDREEENYQTFFDRCKLLPEYGGFPELTAHRATKNCEYIGLIRPSDKYSSKSLTPFYFSLKELCGGDFNKLSSYPDIIDKQLERIYIDSINKLPYTEIFQICPFMFLFKILLLIGDITKLYKISTSEFKLFVATAQNWNEYFEVVESILRYRDDTVYKAECEANSLKVADVRYNVLSQNHSQLNVTKSEIAIKDDQIKNIRRKVAEYELNDTIQSAEDMFNAGLSSTPSVNKSLQQIFYGAPGTGKSHKVKELTGKDNVVRTTFHPDSDYSSFVGCYKPTSIEVPMRDVTGKVIVENGQKVTENRIVYEFVEQAFLKAYIKAWKMYAEDENNPKKQYLVIEEINRGNCAQIFGDLFQLLDRGDNGFSEYPINADKDMQKHLAKAFQDMAYLEAPAIGEMNAEETARAIRSGEKLILPSNLYIWATMNTSDQSLFPIDSAFKRRWDWQYVPIHDGGKGWQIEADGKRYDWWQFVDAMNDRIGTATYSEDKKLGYFFCKAKDVVIDAETFVGKVVFYIWNDVFKDFADEAGNLFKDEDGSMLSFNKFYTIGTDGKRMVVEPKITILMQNLGVEPITTSNSTNDDEPEEDEDNNDDSGSKVRLTITFPDGDVIAGNTKFESYRGALEKIGIQQTLPIAEEKVYQRHNCSLIDTTQRDGILNDPVYSYVKVGDYYIVKGINGKTMRNMLSLISNRLNLDLIINYQ